MIFRRLPDAPLRTDPSDAIAREEVTDEIRELIACWRGRLDARPDGETAASRGALDALAERLDGNELSLQSLRNLKDVVLIALAKVPATDAEEAGHRRAGPVARRLGEAMGAAQAAARASRMN